MSAVGKSEWKKELYIYRDGLPAPPAKDNLQEYIDLYFAENNNDYFGWFLYYYEPELNTKAMKLVQEYSMQGHFADIKQAYVFGMLKALKKYDISLGVPLPRAGQYYRTRGLQARSYIDHLRLYDLQRTGADVIFPLVSAAASVGASAFGRGLHRRPAPHAI